MALSPLAIDFLLSRDAHCAVRTAIDATSDAYAIGSLATTLVLRLF